MTGLRLEARPVVLSAPSGAGKTTIARVLVGSEEDFSFSVSATTRAPRRNETNGVDYWFLSEAEFLGLVNRGELAEWAQVHGDYYGTPKESLVQAGRNGRHVVLDIDVQGAAQIRQAVPDALLLFILPPSVDALLQRLKSRGTEEEESLLRRLDTALRELEAAESFDYFIINEDLEAAVEEVRELARTGNPPPEGSSGTLNDARDLLAGVKSLLQRGTPFEDN